VFNEDATEKSSMFVGWVKANEVEGEKYYEAMGDKQVIRVPLGKNIW
jgi:hypothetical protein